MKKIQGFSMMELLVAMALGLVVVGGVGAVLVSSSTIYKGSESRARIQEGSRFSLGVMQEDVRQSGHMGCFNLDLMPSRYTSIIRDAGFDNQYSTSVAGFNANAGGGWHASLPSTLGKTGFKPLDGSDVLIVRVPVGKSLPLSGVMPSDAAPIPMADDTDLQADRMAVVSDCNYAVLFIMTNVPADKKIDHAATKNFQASLGRIFKAEDGAVVTPVASVAYYIANASNGVAGNKALYRQEDSQNPEEIADGIEQMQIEYMVSVAGKSRTFVTADKLGPLDEVTAVRVHLLLKSQENGAASSAQELQFAGATFKAPDNRLYTPFSTTISLRNQGLN